MEKMITKIKNLLELAGNNPNEHEAMAAALAAQRLMAKYDIDEDQLSDEPNEMEKVIIEDAGGHTMKKWKLALAQCLAKNFRCKVWFIKDRDMATVFYGYKKDAEICKEVFQFLYDTGNRLALKIYNEYRRDGKNTKGLMNMYLYGFRKGIDDELGRQCKALMLVIPKEVEESYQEISMDFRKVKNNIAAANDQRAFERGRREARAALSSRQIEG